MRPSELRTPEHSLLIYAQLKHYVAQQNAEEAEKYSSDLEQTTDLPPSRFQPSNNSFSAREN